jgi:2-polyprenyl-3-methyl-5-hydroxy-6-metoxy-1,4-benzoquinol methylase
VTFTRSDVGEITAAKPVDAVVVRYILMYLPDPTVVLRSLIQLVRPGGIVAFLDISWVLMIALATGLPTLVGTIYPELRLASSFRVSPRGLNSPSSLLIPPPYILPSSAP